MVSTPVWHIFLSNVGSAVLQNLAMLFKQSAKGLLLASVLQVYLKLPITWEKAKILLDKLRAGPDERQASGVPGGGKRVGAVEAAVHPQIVILVAKTSTDVLHRGVKFPLSGLKLRSSFLSTARFLISEGTDPLKKLPLR